MILARMTYEEREELKKKYNVDTILSYSKMSTFTEHPWAYRIIYLEKDLKVDTSNVYTIFGTWMHDLIQSYYEGEITKEELPTKYKSIINDWLLFYPEYRFMSENVQNGYLDNLENYFNTFVPIDKKMLIEKTVTTVVNRNGKNYVLVGYVDAMWGEIDEEGNHHIYILDFKTSSKSGFSGKGLLGKSKQLLIYAKAVHEMTGVPVDNIHVGYDMMKYVKRYYKLKSGKWSKPSLVERRQLVEKLDKQIRGYLVDLGYENPEINELMSKSVKENTLKYLPEEVQDNIKLENGYIFVDFNQEELDNITEWLVDTADAMVKAEQGDWDKEFPIPDIQEGAPESFFYRQLNQGLLQYHPDYQDEIELEQSMNNEMEITDFDELDSLFN